MVAMAEQQTGLMMDRVRSGLGVVARRVGGAAAIGALSLPFVADGAKYEGPVGPLNNVSFELGSPQLDPVVDINFGLLGKVTVPTGLTYLNDLTVHPGPIDDSLIQAGRDFLDTVVQNGSPTESEFLALLGNPVGDLHHARSGLLKEVALGGARVWLGSFIALMGIGYVARRSRRDIHEGQRLLGLDALASDIFDAPLFRFSPVRSRTTAFIAAGGMLVGAIMPTVKYVEGEIQGLQKAISVDAIAGSAQFDGIIAEAVAHYGPEVVGSIMSYIEKNNQFYEKLRTSLQEALDATDFNIDEGDQVIVAHTDNHGNPQIIPLIRLVAEHVGAGVIVDGGDITSFGSDVEAGLLARQWEGNEIPVVAVLGNHDSELVAETLSKAGYIFLRGETIEAAGLRFVGTDDPRFTQPFGQGEIMRSDLTAAETAEGILEKGCEDGADIIVQHDLDDLGDMTDVAYCGKGIFGGHMHPVRTEPIFRINENGDAVMVDLHTMESSAGATANMLRVGPLNGDGGFWVVVYRADGSANVHNVRLKTNGTAEIIYYSKELPPEISQIDGGPEAGLSSRTAPSPVPEAP